MSLELVESARKNETKKVLELLKDPNIDINFLDNNGNNVLLKAVGNDNFELVEKILKYPNIDINHQNKWGFSALGSACFNFYSMDIIEELLNHKKIIVHKRDYSILLTYQTKARVKRFLGMLSPKQKLNLL